MADKVITDEDCDRAALMNEVSLIPAPECKECHLPMAAHDHLRWVCRTADCEKRNVPIHTGAYPFIMKERR